METQDPLMDFERRERDMERERTTIDRDRVLLWVLDIIAPVIGLVAIIGIAYLVFGLGRSG